MVSELTVTSCPHCRQSEPVVRYGYNRGGSAKCRCKACNKIFTPKPNLRRTTPETEQKILRALEERQSIEATARLLKVAKKTIYTVLKKNAGPA
jgi:transposase-like protein